MSLLGQDAPLSVAVGPGASGGGSMLRISAAAFVPRGLPLAAPLDLALDVALDRAGHPRDAVLSAKAGPGRAALGGSVIPFLGATFRATLRPDGPAGSPLASARLTLDRLALRLAGPGGAGGPVITATGALDGDPRADGTLAGALRIALDRVPAADLPRYWPDRVAHDARRWITGNIPSGTVSAATLDATLSSRNGLAGLAVRGVSGGFDARDLPVHWLRPIPPILGAAGRVEIVDADTILITLATGRQGPLDLAGSRMRITGISAPEQIGRIDARIRGPLPAVLAVLSEKRLRLLSRQPLSFDDPRGTVDGRLVVTLPLDDRVTMDQIGITADAHLAQVHLGDVAAGQSIDDGTFRLDADTDGLTMAGRAAIAAIPTVIALRMDFRAGPPAQVTETVHVSGRATADGLRQAGLPIGRIADGAARLDLSYALHRDGDASLDLGCDLADAALVTPLGWRKQPGEPGSVEASIGLHDDHLVSIDRLQATAPQLSIRSHAIVEAGRVRGLALDRVTVGRTDAAGRILLPPSGGGAIAIVLRGTSLDLAPILGGHAPAPRGPHPAAAPAPVPAPASRRRPAQPWEAALDFDRVLLPGKRVLDQIAVRVRGAGSRPAAGRVTAGAPSPVVATLAPVPGGRSLAVTAGDTGALLAGLDVTDDISGGGLRLDGRFDDEAPGDPFRGHMVVTAFTLRRVPWVARLLRDATVYGLLEHSPSPSLTVTRLDAPVRIENGTLALEDARVWQPALGLTASGTVDLRTASLDLDGTIVPAYALNALPGRIPVLGKLFSPEKGGGVFAATWRVRGPMASPSVSVNPLAALVPGVLRKLLRP